MGVGISLNGLASAVSEAGGLGVISAAGLGLLYRHLSRDYLEASILGLREELRQARSKTKHPIGVNIMVALTNFEDLVQTAVDESADVIFCGAGLPLDLPRFARSDRTTALVPIVSSGRAAKILIDKWIRQYNYVPDGIVVEGPLAGGHLGFKTNQLEDPRYSLEEILGEVLREAADAESRTGRPVPVIAAGGIYNGSDMHAFLQRGAAAVQLGTRFVTTYECDASLDFKMSYVRAKPGDLQIIESPVGMPGRAIRNPFLEAVERGEKRPQHCPVKCIKTCNFPDTPYCITLALMNACRGRMKQGYAFAGANAHRAFGLMHVQELMDELQRDYAAATLSHAGFRPVP